jgi:hypothetical protein
MDRTSKILLALIFLALTTNFFKPLFFPKRADAEKPYQVAVLKSEFRHVTNQMEDKISKLTDTFAKHTHKIKICSCDSEASKINVKTSKPE